MLDENFNVPISVQLDPCPAGAAFWDILIECLKGRCLVAETQFMDAWTRKAFLIPVYFVSDMY
jgi:hypothetical protein